MKVAPVDAEIVAGTVEDALIARADAEDGGSAGARFTPGDGLVGGVDGDDGIDIEEDGEVVIGISGGGKS